MLAVTGGVLLVRGVGTRRRRHDEPRSLALGVGACIAGYTLVDDHGVDHAAPIPYFEIVLLALRDPVRARRRRHARLRPQAAADRRSRRRRRRAWSRAYMLVLAALERAEAAPVAALRETSIVMAAAGAAIVGREQVVRRRAASLRRRARSWPGVAVPLALG